jgi:hypothetical protein
MRNGSRKLSAVVLTVWLVAGLAACGGGGDRATKTVTAQAQATTTAAPAGGVTTTKTVTVQAPATTTAAPVKSSGGGGALATYKPSAVISDAGGSETITSPDPVSKLTAFYARQLRKGGWTITSQTVTDYSGNFNAQRGNEGVHISTYTRGSGSGATISTYPI